MICVRGVHSLDSHIETNQRQPCKFVSGHFNERKQLPKKCAVIIDPNNTIRGWLRGAMG